MGGGGGRKNKKEGKKEEKEEKKGKMVLQIRLVFATEKKFSCGAEPGRSPQTPLGPARWAAARGPLAGAGCRSLHHGVLRSSLTHRFVNKEQNTTKLNTP